MHADVMRLAGWLHPYRRRMAGAVGLQSATISAGVLLMATSAWLISAAALHPTIAALQLSIVGVRAFGIARGVLRYAERLVSHDVTLRLLTTLRVRIYGSLEPLAPARLMSRGAGDLLARLVDDVDTLEHLFVRVIGPSLAAFVVALLVVALLVPHGGPPALAALAGLALGALVVPRIGRSIAEGAGRKSVVLRARLNAEIADAAQGVADLVALNAAETYAARIGATATDLQRAQRTAALGGAFVTTFTGLLADLTALAVLALALREPGFDRVSLATVTLLTLAAFEAVSPLPAAWQHLGSIRSAARRVFELIDREPAVVEPSEPQPAPRGHSIAVTGLTFAYPGATAPALRDVTIELAPGRPVALVGANGSGKSTLAHLLLRFWDVPPGTICIDGQDVTQLRSDDVRALVGWVSQRTHLFAGTVRDNLRVARPDADDDLIRDALRRARLEPTIAGLPHGLDTWLGEQGLQLSGGERQRLALARALLKDAPVLVLDEPTSHLDADTERGILAELCDAAGTKALLYITHRFDGLDWMHEVVVLDAGRVAERGTVAELTASDTRYERLRRLQHDRLLSV